MNSKKQLTFTLYFALAGAALGYAIASILLAIAVPFFTNYPLTLVEFDEYAKMRKVAEGFQSYGSMIPGVMGVLYIAALLFVMKIMNPARVLFTRDKVNLFKTLIIFVALGTGFFIAGYSLSEFYNTKTGIEPLRGVAVVITFALIWFFGGTGGWVSLPGGYDLRKVNASDVKATLLYGAACGVVVLGIGVIYNWAFGNFFVLAVDALDGTDEASYAGFMLLTKGIVTLGALGFATFGATMYALLPVNASRQQRSMALRLPITMILGALIVFGISYSRADAKYDLGKKTLDEAALLDTTEPKPRTVVILGKEPLVNKWELKAEYSRMMDSGEVVVSEENISKLEDYLAGREVDSVFSFAARKAIEKSRFVLWQPEQGVEHLVGNMESMLLSRVKLLRRIETGQVNAEMEGYLREFLKADKWHLGKRPLEKMARLLVRHGYMDEAGEYLKLAESAGGDQEVQYVIPEKTPVKDGTISGELLIDGKVPEADTMIGLLGYSSCDDRGKDFEPRLSEFTSAIILLDVVSAGTDGSFEFGSLGEGAYALALNADSTVLSSGKDSFFADGSPGMICIGEDNIMVNTGTIEITTN